MKTRFSEMILYRRIALQKGGVGSKLEIALSLSADSIKFYYIFYSQRKEVIA
uniref:Uncharacterized protein n=1 Tax=Siphoviridae sp. ctDtx1 TaxID=2825391 RepID=A0A8S5PRX4_9CAUD|nr:MAG TPA: hypothetical protein [Siphoviridae sp. ctDtx1]